MRTGVRVPRTVVARDVHFKGDGCNGTRKVGGDGVRKAGAILDEN